MKAKGFGNRGSGRLWADCPLPVFSAAKVTAEAAKRCPGADKFGLMAATRAKQW